MLLVLELLDIQTHALEADIGTLVLKDVAVVGRGEKGDHRWGLIRATPAVQLEALELSFMGSDDRD